MADCYFETGRNQTKLKLKLKNRRCNNSMHACNKLKVLIMLINILKYSSFNIKELFKSQLLIGQINNWHPDKNLIYSVS